MMIGSSILIVFWSVTFDETLKGGVDPLGGQWSRSTEWLVTSLCSTVIDIFFTQVPSAHACLFFAP